MKTRLWLWLGLLLALAGAALAAVLSSPGQRAELTWAFSSMVRPADRPGLRLQR